MHIRTHTRAHEDTRYTSTLKGEKRVGDMRLGDMRLGEKRMRR